MNIYLKAAIRMHEEMLEKPESERHGICQHVKGLTILCFASAMREAGDL